MRSIISRLLFGTVLLLSILVSCEEFDTPDTIDGIWVCREVSSEGLRQVYNINIERASISDTCLFVVYNLFDLGFNFGVDVRLCDSVFIITGTTDVMYNVYGEGIFNPNPGNFKIEWNCDLVGPNVYQPHVNIISVKPNS